jgi:LysM repeat protein
VVSRGQTLSGIARRYGVGLGELAAANGRRVHGLLPVGARLIVPRPVRVASRRQPPPRAAAADAPAGAAGPTLQNPD